MRRRRPSQTPNHERWLVSYADFITLLFAFFVVLYASSRVDQSRVVKVASAMRVAFQELGLFTPQARAVNLQPDQTLTPGRTAALHGAIGVGSGISDPGNLVALKQRLQTVLGPEIQRHAVALSFTHGGLVISLEELGFFDSGSATLKRGSMATLTRIATALRPMPNSLRIEGHTDNVPIHNSIYSSNWALSTARAVEIVRLFIGQFGFSPDRLSAAGYSHYHPVASNATEAGRQRNRRVDVVVKEVTTPETPMEPAPMVAPPAQKKTQ